MPKVWRTTFKTDKESVDGLLRRIRPVLKDMFVVGIRLPLVSHNNGVEENVQVRQGVRRRPPPMAGEGKILKEEGRSKCLSNSNDKQDRRFDQLK